MITCRIISPKEMHTYTEVQAVGLPAYRGRMEVLAGHAEAFVALVRGTVSVRSAGGSEEHISIEDGYCHIRNNEIVVIV